MDVCPPQGPEFLGPRTGQQGHDDVVVHPVAGCFDQYGLRLLRCERLRRAADLSRGHCAELDDVALHLVSGHPEVGGWYTIAGQATGTWALYLNSETPTTRAYLMVYFSDLLGRLGSERLERAAQILEQIPSFKPKIEVARSSGWKRYPSVYLAEVAGKPEEEQAVMTALADLRATT